MVIAKKLRFWAERCSERLFGRQWATANVRPKRRLRSEAKKRSFRLRLKLLKIKKTRIQPHPPERSRAHTTLGAVNKQEKLNDPDLTLGWKLPKIEKSGRKIQIKEIPDHSRRRQLVGSPHDVVTSALLGRNMCFRARCCFGSFAIRNPHPPQGANGAEVGSSGG